MRKTFSRGLSGTVCAAAIVAMLLASCTGKAGRDTFTFALATEVDDYDPFTNMTADGRSVLFNIYEGLVRAASNEEMAAGGRERFLPCLADRWDHNDECSSWTFHIKSGVLFHDGSPVTADDAARSLVLARDAGFAGLGNIAEVSSEGDAVTVLLRSPDTSFLAAMTSPVVNCADSRHFGTGPYMLKEYVAGDYAVLSRFEEYHAEKPFLQSVKVKFLGSQSALPLALLSGAIDGFVATGDLSREVADDKAVKYAAPSNAVQMLALNNAAPKFRDKKARQFIRSIIDADDVIQKAAGGFGVRAISPVIPALMQNDDALLSEVAYNKGSAVALPIGFEAKDLSFAITVPSNYTVHVKTAEVIAAALSQAGVQCRIKQVDWATWLSEVYMGRDYEATIISVDAPLASSASFLSRYVSSAGDNFVNFNSASFDEAFGRLQSAKHDADKEACARDAVKCLIDEAASVWIEDIEQVTVYSKRFKGFRSYPLFAIDFSAISAY